ncbi:MAG: tetratricopeptide repeat protein, partial [Cyclobacteriaceae bacterium]|nr:tetratricopeptide repeat protein [Cyclobacteriaceae bacterium]
MAKEYRKREEGNELIKRFEDHLRKKKAEFFDLDAYEQIIDHYMMRGKHSKALHAVNQAISQYPFSIELITLKAQILSNLEEYGQALDLLDQAHALQPNDPEIFLTKGSILSLQGNHAEAIENYEQALLLADDKDEVYYSLGLAHQSMEDYQRAIDAYKMSI